MVISLFIILYQIHPSLFNSRGSLSQFRPRLLQLLNLLELVKEVQTPWVKQRPTWLDGPPGNDVLDW
jgi:hypothetical protein